MSYYFFDFDEDECLFELKYNYNKSIPLCCEIKNWMELGSWPRELPSRRYVENMVRRANFDFCGENNKCHDDEKIFLKNDIDNVYRYFENTKYHRKCF